MVTGGVAVFFFFNLYQKSARLQDPKYNINTLVLAGSERGELKGALFAELLGLSIDRPTHSELFDLKMGEEKLLSCPVIKEASIHKIYPSGLYIEYNVVTPAAYLGGYHNAALDREGYVFPMSPYLTPKRLPVVYLEEQEIAYGKKVSPPGLDLAFFVLNKIMNWGEIVSIDVSTAFAPSLGEREVVICLEEKVEREMGIHSLLCVYPRILRCNCEEVERALDNYLVVRDYLSHKEKAASVTTDEALYRAPVTVVDLRLLNSAYTY